MSTSEDVANLFSKFGGTPDQYQELSRESRAEESRARWPLLASLRLTEHAVAPSVRDGRQPVPAAPVPHLQGREQVAGMSPFAPVPEITREQVREALLDMASVGPAHAARGEETRAGGVGRALFRATPPVPSPPGRAATFFETPAARGGERPLARLRGAVGGGGMGGTAGASGAPGFPNALNGSAGASDEAGRAPAAMPPAASGNAPGASGVAAHGGAPRPLTAVFAKLAAEPAASRASGSQKSSLFARLSRL